jgi:hypothetical protein
MTRTKENKEKYRQAEIKAWKDIRAKKKKELICILLLPLT